jgi:hypothetical protein
MASEYKFKINSIEGKYVFQLYPNNSNTQPIGECWKKYSDIDSCRKALDSFKEIISKQDISLMLKKKKSSNDKWLPIIEYHGNVLFTRTIPYDDSSSCDDWASRIKDNINAEVL